MSLRRIAQENNASGSPRQDPSVSTPSSPHIGTLPFTPRNRSSYGVYRSPASTPSISSSVPFDWVAARTRQPPPYASPLQNKARGSMSSGTTSSSGPQIRKRVVRRKSLFEKISSIPSTVAFQIALFPHNVPLPSSNSSARLIGGAMHFLHFCVRVSQSRKVPDSDTGWEDMYREGDANSWFDWTVPVTIFLITASISNAIYLFSRLRFYQFHHRADPISSPNAAFVPAPQHRTPLHPVSLVSRIRLGTWHVCLTSWRFLTGFQPSVTSPAPTKRIEIQQLSVWAPGDLELELFCVYSPAHTVLWLASGPSNWMLMLMIMGMVGIQLNALTHSYKALLKDKDIISAEVMKEYNQSFVYPRTNPIRKDVAVMTHESEIVNIWEE